MQPEVGIGIVVAQDGKVLMGRRRNAHGDGTWSIPGGHLEFCETFEQCAKREMFEETSLQIANVRVFDIVENVFAKEGKHYVSIITIADCIAGTPTIMEPKKCDALEWFGWDELPENLFAPVGMFMHKPGVLERLKKLC